MVALDSRHLKRARLTPSTPILGVGCVNVVSQNQRGVFCPADRVLANGVTMPGFAKCVLQKPAQDIAGGFEAIDVAAVLAKGGEVEAKCVDCPVAKRAPRDRGSGDDSAGVCLCNDFRVLRSVRFQGVDFDRVRGLFGVDFQNLLFWAIN